ncbi:MAG TPA: hypothetical protein VKB02_12475 [Pyrinomonadaceae bacterium]|nr:hypothetical protein [Pyrinomonadaceae bacterium]
MKIAVVSESPADEAAIKILVDAILGHETELVSAARLRPGGWPQVLQLIPSILKALHYYTDAEGIAVVVDSDSSPVHLLEQPRDQECHSECRICLLRNTLRTSLSRVSSVPNRATIKTAVGLAVPAIEAWYRCGLDAHVNEARWSGSLAGEKIHFTKRSLKVDVYGSDQPSLRAETTTAVEAAHRLVHNIEQLGQLFPSGFGCLMADVRGWL